MMNIEFSSEAAAKSTSLLNGLLADHFTLLLKIWQFHWNVEGKSFDSFHSKMKELYEAEIDFVDNTAERIRAVRGVPLTSMEAMLQNNHIQEWVGGVPPAMEMWNIIYADYETIINRIRVIHEQVDSSDLGTLNFLEDMITKMEKDAWMIRSILNIAGK